MIFSLPACVFAIRGNIGVAFFAHLVLLLVDPIFAFSFWMAMRALHASQAGTSQETTAAVDIHDINKQSNRI